MLFVAHTPSSNLSNRQLFLLLNTPSWLELRKAKTILIRLHLSKEHVHILLSFGATWLHSLVVPDASFLFYSVLFCYLMPKSDEMKFFLNVYAILWAPVRVCYSGRLSSLELEMPSIPGCPYGRASMTIIWQHYIYCVRHVRLLLLGRFIGRKVKILFII